MQGSKSLDLVRGLKSMRACSKFWFWTVQNLRSWKRAIFSTAFSSGEKSEFLTFDHSFHMDDIVMFYNHYMLISMEIQVISYIGWNLKLFFCIGITFWVKIIFEKFNLKKMIFSIFPLIVWSSNFAFFTKNALWITIFKHFFKIQRHCLFFLFCFFLFYIKYFDYYQKRCKYFLCRIKNRTNWFFEFWKRFKNSVFKGRFLEKMENSMTKLSGEISKKILFFKLNFSKIIFTPNAKIRFKFQPIHFEL